MDDRMLPELETAAQKQGIIWLAEVERAMLEPSGAIVFITRKPEPDVARHQAIMARLDELGRELAALHTTKERMERQKAEA